MYEVKISIFKDNKYEDKLFIIKDETLLDQMYSSFVFMASNLNWIRPNTVNNHLKHVDGSITDIYYQAIFESRRIFNN